MTATNFFVGLVSGIARSGWEGVPDVVECVRLFLSVFMVFFCSFRCSVWFVALHEKSPRSRAAIIGWAAELTPAQDNTPPFSTCRARDCAAGDSETRANNSLVAAVFCAKQNKVCSEKRSRQVVQNRD